jgi:hydrogenase nickel insertion protein HypA
VHELSVATELLAMCQQNLPCGAALQRVRIAVGDLASIEPELLRFAFAAVVAGTPHAGVELVIEWHPARQRCAQCGDVAERQPGTWLRLCPRCQLPLHVVGGDELDLLEVVPASSSPSSLEVSS